MLETQHWLYYVLFFWLVSEVDKYIGVSEGIVSNYIKRNLQYLKGHLFKRYSDKTQWFDGFRLNQAIDKSGIAIEIKDCIDGSIHSFNSVFSAHNFKGLHYANITTALRNHQQYLKGGFLVRRTMDSKPWLSDEEVDELLEFEKTGVYVWHPIENKAVMFSTMAEAATWSGKAKNTVKYQLTNGPGKTLDGFEFKWVKDYVTLRKT